MRWFPLTVLGLALAGSARGEDIVDVLRRSQQQRLETYSAAPDGPRAQTVRRSFELLRRALAPEIAVDLIVISGGTLAETLHGRIIVAGEALADAPEGERLFILAHELGHVSGQHWQQMGQLYKRWVPGAVTPENTDPVAGAMGREASGLSHQHEFSADAFALQALRDLGLPAQPAFSAFLRQGMQHDTATHPATRKRVAALRAAQALVAAPSSGNAE